MAPSARNAAARTPGAGSVRKSSSELPVVARSDASERRDHLGPECGIEAGPLQHADEHRGGGARLERRERPHRLERHERLARDIFGERQQHGHRRRCLCMAEPPRGKRAGVDAAAPRQGGERRRGARILRRGRARRRRGHHSDTGCPSGVEHDRGKRLVRLQARERVQRRDAPLRPRGAMRVGQIVGRDRAQHARVDVRPHHRRDVGRMRLSRPMAPSASAARPCTSGDASFNAGHRASVAALLADQPERERRHLPHFRIRVGRQHARERDDAVDQADPARPPAPRAGARADRRRSAPRAGRAPAAPRVPLRAARRLRAASAAVGRRGGASPRRMRWSSSRMIQASDWSNVGAGGRSRHGRRGRTPVREQAGRKNGRARSCVSRLCQCLHAQGGALHEPSRNAVPSNWRGTCR